MGNLKTKDLTKIGYTNNQLISLVLGIAGKHYKHQSNEQIIAVLTQIKNNPQQYLDDEVNGKIAERIIGKVDGAVFKAYELQPAAPYQIYGGKDIEASAKKQMELAMRLPVSVQGALMPDAHMGFGLPIGGVLAVELVAVPGGDADLVVIGLFGRHVPQAAGLIGRAELVAAAVGQGALALAGPLVRG